MIQRGQTEGARAARSDLFAQSARPPWLARFFRRARLLAALALAILSCRKGFRGLAPAAWGFIAGLLWLAAQPDQLGWYAAPSLVLFVALSVAALIDARYFILPDGPLLVLALAGVALRLAAPVENFAFFLSAAAFAFAVFRAAAWAFEKARGYPGLGQGDARLFALAGLWLGWDGLASCLLIAALSGALAATIALRDRALAHPREPLAFGPHLALGFWLVWAVGPLIPA
ncbi:A24 family peptidase [Rhodoblastus acidophilus]|uniref:A24 family peptidase n=1 Tax=Candidatus Rhodoblastus alkanivorans TaxID=2954117 RepID=A0ABS9ZA19_9HYPH|nr:A24 family peptidase [Candidatus Rhodoblastus alkanivorans]MCI4677150.1 A24 family peptidase [Candidatus Rhodoblastus alkanivorans]MCI4684503.1 A24 family peptidase [Candidatus Rhodoblastus alkanivorans]MDI4641824.1 A24 family peptidase [Rhodoblastus acidophilus]